MKYLNGPFGGLIGLNISQRIHSKNIGDSIFTLAGDSLIINLLWQQTSHISSLDRRIIF